MLGSKYLLLRGKIDHTVIPGADWAAFSTLSRLLPLEHYALPVRLALNSQVLLVPLVQLFEIVRLAADAVTRFIRISWARVLQETL